MNEILRGGNDIREALDDVSRVWNHFSPDWDDEAKRHFESVFVAPMLDIVPCVLEPISQLSVIVEQARLEIE